MIAYKNILLLTTISLCIVLASYGQQQTEKKEYEVEIMAYDYAFHAPDELPTGWITFLFNNETAHEVHELSFARLPEGITYDEYLAEYIGAWEILLKEFQDGTINRDQIGTRVNELLPDWSDGVEYINARGLVSPGRKAKKTVFLEPGKYALDCWVKSPEGIIHISSGMTRPLTITEEPANSTEPNPEAGITLNEDTIEIDWEPKIGVHSFALHLSKDEDGAPYHNNIHLVGLEEDTDLEEVNSWMDWYRKGGLRSPAPVDFLGGVSTYDALPGENATYFSLDIKEPGNYAWIVQVPEGQQLWETFTIE